MKHKYKIIVCMIVIIAGSAASFFQSIQCSVWLKAYKEEIAFEEAYMAYEKMITFCEKNQNELVAVSDQYLSKISKAVSQEEIIDSCRQFTDDSKTEWLSDKMSLKCTNYKASDKNRLQYHCKSFYTLDEFNEKIYCNVEVLYIDEEEGRVEEYMDESPVYYRHKVNDHLYVLLMEWQYQ